MASICAIDRHTVHQIQSGQVISDLCSVVKELVENALDAGATAIDIRFKDHGLESIEVQDNGSGIGPDDFETVALKHHTSKLKSFEDLESVQTFGFRGEALSSLCALSDFHVTTARGCDTPRAHQLHYDHSGQLSAKAIVAGQKGTTVAVESIFKNLPVRRKNLAKNVKREYGKALSLLQAYACISTGVRLSVANQPSKGSKSVAFSTKANPSTRENIVNVYGAKTAAHLLPLSLTLSMQPSGNSISVAQRSSRNHERSIQTVLVVGHVSRPVFGEGRQTPDRQMFFVNARPCSLPQVAKAFNEVYRGYNMNQSPFILADLRLDTSAYDVNVSPDKRTILLHDQATLLETLKEQLVQAFDRHEQSVPRAFLKRNMLAQASPLSGAVDTPLQRLPSDECVNESLLTSDRRPSQNDTMMDESQTTISMDSTSDQEDSASLSQTETGHIAENRVNLTPKNFPTTEKRIPEHRSQATRIDGFKEDYATFSAHIGVPPATLGSKEIGLVENACNQATPKRKHERISEMQVDGVEIYRLTSPSPPGGGSDHSDSESGDRAVWQRSGSVGKSMKHSGRSRDGGIYEAAHDVYATHPYNTTSNLFSAKESPDYDTASPGESSDIRSSQSQNHAQEDNVGAVEVVERDSRRLEEARVSKLIADAEASILQSSDEKLRRATRVLKGRHRKDSTLQLIYQSNVAIVDVEAENKILSHISRGKVGPVSSSRHAQSRHADFSEQTEEARLSLTVFKDDFARMRIVGQFNLGFIVALRTQQAKHEGKSDQDIFIIDQHAADEKYNFEQLAANTTIQNQRMVRPQDLELTAVEEEILMNRSAMLAQNGFQIETDMTGRRPVGKRCKLVALPTSKEVIFNHKDLEELIALLAEDGRGDEDHTTAADDEPGDEKCTHEQAMQSDVRVHSSGRHIIRPSKVRRLLAMRACRSSIMVGRALTRTQMQKVAVHMGEMDKPWNCPHGRPTMRHLTGFDSVGERGWTEGMGVVGLDEIVHSIDWNTYGRAKAAGSDHT